MPPWAALSGPPKVRFGPGYSVKEGQQRLRELLDLFRYTPADYTGVIIGAAQETAQAVPTSLLLLDGAVPSVVAAAMILRMLGLGRIGLLCTPADIAEICSGSEFKGASKLERLMSHRLVHQFYDQVAYKLNIELDWPHLVTRSGLLRLLDKLEIELVSTDPKIQHELQCGPMMDFLVHRLEGTHSISERLKEETKTGNLHDCARTLLEDAEKQNLWRAAARTALQLGGWTMCLGGRAYKTKDVATAALVAMRQPGEGLSSHQIMARRMLGPDKQGVIFVTDPAYDPKSTVAKRVASTAFCAELLNMIVEYAVILGLPPAIHYAAPFTFSTNGSADDEHVGDQRLVAEQIVKLVDMPYVKGHWSTVQIDAALELVLDSLMDERKLEPHLQGAFGLLTAKSVVSGNSLIKALGLMRALFDRAGPASHFISADPNDPWGGRPCPLGDLSRADGVLDIVLAAAAMIVYQVVHDFAAREQIRQRLRRRFAY